ncbi:hypothetical protein [Nostoc sp.]|uniref:hypothetical protein n=1 Tax=Nostoc sp. TaxID=1180 RepID=UPI002FF8A577
MACLVLRPVGLIAESNFEWMQEPIPTPGEGQILVRNIYLSLVQQIEDSNRSPSWNGI